ncbi:hypothetical protein EB061_13225, partial [bacterium]|nr:hypothetical protein [bacterium]
ALAVAGIIMMYEWIRIVWADRDFASRFLWIWIGLVWVGLPLLAIGMLRQLSFGEVMFPLLLIWLTDTMAYVGGRLLGGRKMAPSISPGKTWSGAITGFLCAAVFSAIWHYPWVCIECDADAKSYILYYSAMGALLSIISQISDLLESKFKRHFGVKDSGKIIPGHGGLLDRTDSLVLTLPAYLFFVMYTYAG